MFLARAASLRERPNCLTASTVMPVRSTGWTAYVASESSSRGLAVYPALVRLRAEKSWVSTMIVAPGGRSPRLARRAAGFIATSTSGASPGVRMSWSAKWTWNDETPGSVPCGARISAGKFGRVERSLPKAADSWVKRSPVSCMPSPESPAKRMMTRSSCLTCLVTSRALLDLAHQWPATSVRPPGRGRVEWISWWPFRSRSESRRRLLRIVRPGQVTLIVSGLADVTRRTCLTGGSQCRVSNLSLVVCAS